MKFRDLLNFHIPFSVKVLISLVVLSFLSVSLFFFEENSKFINLYAGFTAGLICCFFYFLMEISLYRKLDKFEKMGIQYLLSNRHDKNHYRSIFSSTSSCVKVMGSTCARFINDFLDIQSDDRVLVDNLRNNKKFSVQLLMPESNFMTYSESTRFGLVQSKIDQLNKEFGKRFEIRRFSFEARHSFVIADDIVIAGPIFNNFESMYSPAVQVDLSTQFGQKYLEYFDAVAEGCENNS